jgi:hypothetical protein
VVTSTADVPRAVGKRQVAAAENVPARFTGGLLLLAAGGIIGILSAVHPTGHAAIVFAVVGLVVLAIGAVGLVAKSNAGKALATMELLPWLIAYMAITFGLTSLAWLAPQGGTSRIIQPASIAPAVLAVGAFLAVLSLACLTHVSIFRRPFRLLAAWSLRGAEMRFRTRNVPIVVYVLGVAARLIRVALGRYAYLGNASQALSGPSSANQLLAQMELFTRFAIVLLVFDALIVSRSYRSRMLLIAAFVIECGFAGISGVKGELITLLFALGIGLVASGRRIRLKWVGMFAAAFLMLVPINLTYRAQISQASSSSRSSLSVIHELPSIASDALQGQSPPQALRSSAAFAAQRLREIDNMAVIMQRSPGDVPYRSPTELLIGPVAGLVPRAVWPAKPILSTGYEFSQRYYNLPSTLYTASAVTVPGDLYRHGGWFVLIAGAMVLGLVMRSVQDVFHPRADPRLALFYCALFLQLTNIEVDVVTMIVSIAQMLLVAAVLTRLCYGRRA